MVREAPVQIGIREYVQLDAAVDGAERDGIVARWEFGLLMLQERDANGGKQLPTGRLGELSNATGKTGRELQYRAKFAELYTSEEEVRNAFRTFGSWYEIVKRGLPQEVGAAKRDSSEHETCTVDDLCALIRAGKTFGTIYADPPWRYDNQATRASTKNHYKAGEDNPESGMTVKQICSLPVSDLAQVDAHLHLWTTNGFLFECPRIFDAWGFEFRSSFVWVKPQIGIGNYWRNSHEFMLTAIRGDAKRFNDKNLRSWTEAKRARHSAKPEAVRKMIEKASPGPRLELFGRRIATGWTVWGNEIERTMFDSSISEVA